MTRPHTVIARSRLAYANGGDKAILYVEKQALDQVFLYFLKKEQ
jgi:hypothetical protein